jgi:hypothetical protein
VRSPPIVARSTSQASSTSRVVASAARHPHLFPARDRSRFCEAIERLLSRKVRGFTSGIDVTHDISSETFYLESAGEPGDGSI